MYYDFNQLMKAAGLSFATLDVYLTGKFAHIGNKRKKLRLDAKRTRYFYEVSEQDIEEMKAYKLHNLKKDGICYDANPPKNRRKR